MKLPRWSGWLFGAAAIGTAVAVSRSAGGAPVIGPDSSAPQPTVQLGSKGPAVTLLQHALSLSESGLFDAATLAAVKAFQASHSLQADGIVGPKTWAALGYTGSKPASHYDAAPGATPVPKHQEAEALPDVPHIDSGSSGRTWASMLPKKAVAEREAQILAAVDSRFYITPDLVPITYVKDGHTVTIYGWSDALAIGTEDPIRVNVWHSTAQRIADRLGLMLPTTRMADAAWTLAANLNDDLPSAKLPTLTTNADSGMADTSRMIKESDMIENARRKNGIDSHQLGRDNGKDWVNTERLIGAPLPTHSTIGGGGGSVPAGANFGWHGGGYKSPGGMAVFQSVGLAHDMNYTDYSQMLTLYGKDATVDGVTRSVASFLADPATAYLLSDEVKAGQAAQIWRHPAVPEGG